MRVSKSNGIFWGSCLVCDYCKEHGRKMHSFATATLIAYCAYGIEASEDIRELQGQKWTENSLQLLSRTGLQSISLHHDNLWVEGVYRFYFLMQLNHGRRQ